MKTYMTKEYRQTFTLQPMRMSSYVLPVSVQKVVCLRAKTEWPRRIVLMDAHATCKWRGKPKLFPLRPCDDIPFINENAYVAVYVPWINRQSNLSRMIYDGEMESMQCLRVNMLDPECSRTLTTDNFRNLRDTMELLVKTFNHRHGYFHTLLDEAIELQAMSILCNVPGPETPF